MRQLDPAAVEWLVLRTTGEDLPAAGFEQDGDKRTLADATTRVQQLGPPWVVNHFHTLVPPNEHQRWINGAGRMWAP